MTTQKVLGISLVFLAATLTNCGKAANDSGTVDDSSASGAAAGAVGGALNSSSQSSKGSMMMSRLEDAPMSSGFSLCPTWHTTANTCSASGSEMWLSYSSCSFAGFAQWNGVQAITMSSGSAACGTFPNPGANGILYRQYVQASGGNAPGELTLSSNSATGTVDDATANLGNFNGDSISTIINGGYGHAVNFNASGARSQVTVGHHLVVQGEYDHSISGSVSVNESVGASTRVVNGSVEVYHNLLRIIGTSTFDNVIHSDVCCLPIGGSITTAFSAGANATPTREGALAVGKSETLTFTGCGTGTLKKYDGSVVNVSLNHCF